MPMPVEKALCTTCLHLSRMVPVQYRPFHPHRLFTTQSRYCHW